MLFNAPIARKTLEKSYPTDVSDSSKMETQTPERTSLEKGTVQ